jgi:hypothetical protein
MMKHTAVTFSSLGRLCLATFTISQVAFAATITISAAGTGTVMLSPSADTVVLNSSSSFTTSNALFALQTGVYSVGNSGNLTGTFPFTISENITVDGQTELVTLAGQNFVTNPSMANTDVLTIFAGPSTFFSTAGVFITTQQYMSSPFGVGGTTPFTLMATQSVSTPEPGSMSLLLLALVFLLCVHWLPTLPLAGDQVIPRGSATATVWSLTSPPA